MAEEQVAATQELELTRQNFRCEKSTIVDFHFLHFALSVLDFFHKSSPGFPHSIAYRV